MESNTGKVLNEVVLEIPLDYEGLRGINVFGDSIYIDGRANRTVVYSLATGKEYGCCLVCSSRSIPHRNGFAL